MVRRIVTALAVLALAASAQAADIVRYVDTGSTPGGSGETNATAGADRAYASLAEWEAAEQQDLTDGSGDTMTVHCNGTAADTTSLTVNGWITDNGQDITIQVDQDVRHGGKWDASAYRLSVANDTPLRIRDDHTAVIGLQIEKTAANANAKDVLLYNSIGAANSILVSECIVRASGTDAYTEAGIKFNDTSVLATVRNCVIYGGGTLADVGNAGISSNAGAITVQNCTVNGFYHGIRKQVGDVTAINCLANGASNDDFSGGFHASSSNNAASDATAPGGNSRQNQTFTFVTPGSDFHITGADAGARTFGVDLRPLFDTDIDGDPRGSVWDIGADQITPAGIARPLVDGGLASGFGGLVR